MVEENRLEKYLRNELHVEADGEFRSVPTDEKVGLHILSEAGLQGGCDCASSEPWDRIAKGLMNKGFLQETLRPSMYTLTQKGADFYCDLLDSVKDLR